ncbi:amino acid permease [Longimicrobium sp.]|uniref:amino acid permease n=1 Tax=Longimicrobium sp. TaxID=2029185 RepID=UPI002CA4CBEA|nr:amino acid permease [Longimicrobium sp.]HSU16894.1 amino acid permease [Longimicrobium sp.]
MNALFRRKPISEIRDEHVDPQTEVEHGLRRSLGVWQLTALGIGAIIGAGIFSGAGTAVSGGPNHPGAGPGLVVSYVLVAIACGFAALCYAEFASLIPQAGSAYTYAYATLGELIAWIIGWDLIIEYAVGNIAVAVSWSAYFTTLLSGFGIHMPSWLATDPRTAFQGFTAVHAATPSTDPTMIEAAHAWTTAPHILGFPVIINLPAVLIVALITWILVIGIRESAWANTVMVILKLAILFFFIAMGSFWVKPANWHPFMPNGWNGVFAGAALIFFAYIGFDAVSTAAEEAKDPQRDMPKAMILSLIATSIIYIVVTLVMTGLVPWNSHGSADPLAAAFTERGYNWAAGIISFGAVIAMASVLLVFQMGQPRIFFSMARDGLLPPFAAKLHPKYRTPHVTTILTGAFVAFFAAFANINEVIELTNIGTLFAFVLVAVGVMALRLREPERHRPFRTPAVWFVAPAAILSCGFLMYQLPLITWKRFVIWLVVGLVFYFLYGYWKSNLRDRPAAGS